MTGEGWDGGVGQHSRYPSLLGCWATRAKTHNYINLILGDHEVKARDPDALAILLDMNGNLCEGWAAMSSS